MDPNVRRRRFILLLLIMLYKQQRQDRRWWVRPIFRKRREQGAYNNLIQEMRLNDVESFFNFFRMTPETFDELLFLVGPAIAKKHSFRSAISAEERLAVTLRYLASGDSMTSLSYLFRLGKATVSIIIRDVCKSLWDILFPRVLAPPTAEKWEQIAENIDCEWQFPNCLGAMDGKHVVMQAPNSTGSEFFNYKHTFSIVLLAVCDGNYKFTIVDIGASGRQSDGGIFRTSNFGQALESHKLKIPEPKILEGTSPPKCLPYVFVADEAFPLKKNLMRPYPGKNLTLSRRVYNYRLSRCRRVIENTFGILCSRFRIFRRPIIAKVETVEDITKAAVCLHNFLKIGDDRLPVAKKRYCPFGYSDYEDANGVLHAGQWRLDGQSNGLQNLSRTSTNTFSRDAAEIRSDFKEYFCGPGAVSWQMKHVTGL